MLKVKINNRIKAEYESIEENFAEIQRLINQITSSVDLIRYLNYFEKTIEENKEN